MSDQVETPLKIALYGSNSLKLVNYSHLLRKLETFDGQFLDVLNVRKVCGAFKKINFFYTDYFVLQ